MLLKRSLAEFVGTYALVFFGTGAIVIDHLQQGVIGHLGVSIAFGIVVLAMIYTFGDISGAHLNPAVTLGFWVSGRLPALTVPAYLLSQFAGAVSASATLWLLFPSSETYGATVPSGPPLQSFFLEIILTMILMLVIIHVSTGSKEQGIMAGIAIGATVGLEALVGGPICGASMNPARSLAPAIISGNFTHLWIYFTGPVIGALASIATWKIIQPLKTQKI